MTDEELLTRLTCETVILRAAQMLAAVQMSDEDAAGFEWHGYPDPTLCRVDGRSATSDERSAYDRWRCCRDVLQGGEQNAERLGLVECIHWLTTHSEPWGGDEGEDSVTYDEVLEVVIGRPL